MSVTRKSRTSKPKAVRPRAKPTAAQEKAAKAKADKAKAAAEKAAEKARVAEEKRVAKAKAAEVKRRAADEKKRLAAAAKIAKQKAADEKKRLAAAAKAARDAEKKTTPRPRKTKPKTPKVAPDSLTLESIADQIREAYLAQTRGAVKERVLLKDLRPRVGVQRADFDQALLAMQRQSRVVLMGLDNPVERTPEVEAAALHIAGHPRYLVYFQG